MKKCDRCGKDAFGFTMSMFNTEDICMDCKTEEKKDPRYVAAVKADEDAIRSGNFNFKGIGR